MATLLHFRIPARRKKFSQLTLTDNAHSRLCHAGCCRIVWDASGTFLGHFENAKTSVNTALGHFDGKFTPCRSHHWLAVLDVRSSAIPVVRFARFSNPQGSPLSTSWITLGSLMDQPSATPETRNHSVNTACGNVSPLDHPPAEKIKFILYPLSFSL